MKTSYFKAQIALGVVCAILAFAITTQLISVQKNNAIIAKQSQRSEDLQLELGKEKEKNADLNLQIYELQASLQDYQKEAANKSDSNRVLSDQLKKAEVLAGLTEVEGSGIILTVSDSSKDLSQDMSLAEKESLIIHDSDLRLIITELAAAGAEAYSINGQRVVATSPIRCVGPVVNVNEVKVAPPFEIKAIGEPKTLEAAVNMRGGLADMFKSVGIDISVKSENKITIPRYMGVVNLKFGVPVIDATGSAKAN